MPLRMRIESEMSAATDRLCPGGLGAHPWGFTPSPGAFPKRSQRLFRECPIVSRGFQRALAGSPAAALDRMWVEAVRQVSSGEFAARVALLGVGDAAVRAACRPPEEALPALAAAIGDAIALDGFPAARAETTLAVCEGLQALLMMGGDPHAARDAFDRWWIAQLPG